MAIPINTGLTDNNQANPTQTGATAWTSATTVGNLIVYSISISGTTNTTAPTVSSCNNGASTPLSFLNAVSNGTGGNAIRLEIWYGVVQAASQQISITASGGPCNIQCTSAEYFIGTYTNVVDVSSATNTGSGTTITSGTLTTTNPNDLLIMGSGWVRNQTPWTTGPTNSFTDEKGISSAGGGTGSNNTSALANNINDLVVTTTGSYSSGGTIGASAKWANVLVSFKVFNPALAVNEYIPDTDSDELDMYKGYGIFSYAVLMDPFASLAFNDYEPDMNEVLFDDLGDEQAWYPPVDEYTELLTNLQVPLDPSLVENDYSPLELEQLIEDSEGDYYPDFGVDLSFFLPIVTENFIFNDYEPDLNEILFEDIGDEQSWYAPSSEELMALISSQRLSILIIDTPMRSFGESSDGSDYDPYNDESAAISLITSAFNLGLVVLDYSPDPWTDNDTSDSGEYDFQDDQTILEFIIYTELFVENDYSPLELDQLIEDLGEGDYYPDFSLDLSWYLSPQNLLVFNDYEPEVTDILTEDSEGDYYPDFSIDLSFFLPIVTETFVFNDYEPELNEVLFDDSGDELAWYAPKEEELQWFVPPPAVAYLIFNDYVSMELETLTEDSEGDYYPDFSTDITWFLPIVTENFIFNDYSPDPWSDDDTGEEPGWHTPQDTDAALINITIYTELFVENDYTPWETETITDDSGDSGEYDPLYDNVESWYSTFSQLIVENPFIDYLELYTDDSSDSGEYDLPFEELLQWFIPPVTVTYLVFNDYIPIDTDQLIEDSEADLYPDFSIDLSWYFAQVFQLDISLFFEEYIPGDTEQLIEDDGSEQSWYPPIDSDALLTITILTELFIFSDYSPVEVDQLIDDTSDEPAWYAPSEEQLQWFIPLFAVAYLIFNEYTPGETETLTEEQEGDYYPDFSVDITWFLPIVTENFIFNDYGPLELEQLTEDEGSEQAWYPPLDSDPILLITVYTELFVENDYAPINWEDDDTSDEQAWYPPLDSDPVLLFIIFTELFVENDYNPMNWEDDDTGEEPAWYPPQDELLSWFIPNAQALYLIFNEYIPADTEELIEDVAEGDFYPDFSIDLSWFTPIVTEDFIFNDYSPVDNEELIEDSEGDYYPDFGIDLAWYLSPQTLLVFNEYIPTDTDQLIEEQEGDYYPDFGVDITWFLPIVTENFIFNDYSPLELEQLTDDSGDEQAWYAPFWDDSAILFAQGLFPFNTLEFEWKTIDIPELQIEDQGNEDIWYGPFGSIDWIITFFVPPIPVENLIASDENASHAIPDPFLLDDDSDLDSWYGPLPDNMDDLFFLIGQNFEVLIASGQWEWATPDIYEDDTSEEQAWYPAWEEQLQWFIPFQLPSLLVFDDYSPREAETISEELEGDYYPDFSIDLGWYFVQVFALDVSLFFNIYAPLELEEIIEDLGDEQAWYPPIDTDGALVNSTILTELFVENDYAPLDNEQLIEESDADYYTDLMIDISWYISPSTLLVFNDYIPTDLEELTEESEGDYYPDFGIDLGWYFNQVVFLSIFLIVMANQSDDSGNSVPLSYETVMDDLSDEPAWYTPLDTDASLVTQTIVTELFIENDYSPLDNEQLGEELEGDYYPDFSIDIGWFFALGQPAFVIFNDYAPVDTEQLIEDKGSEEAWYYGLFYLGIVISYVHIMALYLPVSSPLLLYMPLTETDSETGMQILVLYFPLQGTASGGNIVGTS